MTSRKNEPQKKLKAYVDFTCYHENVRRSRVQGTLPNDLDFD